MTLLIRRDIHGVPYSLMELRDANSYEKVIHATGRKNDGLRLMCSTSQIQTEHKREERREANHTAHCFLHSSAGWPGAIDSHTIMK